MLARLERSLVLAAAALVMALVTAPGTAAQDASAFLYRVTFPEAEHHWMEVEATFPSVGSEPLDLRMSRSSPGRYAVHEFAKNVFSLQAFDRQGRSVSADRVGVDTWRVAGHGGTVRVVYRIFGDHADGTYLAIDTTHAHINMPAAFLWPAGHERRAIRVTFVPPTDSRWRAGTQLIPTADPFVFTAPNLQYFMDSPTELSAFVESTFTVPERDGTLRRFRVVVHADVQQPDVDALASSIERLVREQQAVYGELPELEPGAYTFLLDYMPWVEGDAMEHRNSTFVTTPGVSLASADERAQALDTISHEFFHVWNVERIRPVGLEPFDFTRQNVTCCLWLAEGFTQYYGPLLLARASLGNRLPLSYAANVMNSPARGVRSAVEMSEHAPFADASVSVDADDRNRTFISYYVHGAALALALDFALREHSNGTVTLDDYMRALWVRFGRPASEPGYVDRPYSLGDLRGTLADVARSQSFADTFFSRYVEGRDVPDFPHLLNLAGYTVRAVAPTRGWIGTVPVSPAREGLEVGTNQSGRAATLVPFDSPLYRAGIDAGDLIVMIDNGPASTIAWNAIALREVGSRVALTVRRRDGRIVQTTVTVEADPRVQIVPTEEAGGTVSAAQRAFRDAWLRSRVP